MRINAHSSARGKSLRIDPSLVSMTAAYIGGSPLDTELRLGQTLLEKAGLIGHTFDSVVLTSSLPRRHCALLCASLIRQAGIKTGRVLEFSGHCGVILDAMHYSFSSADPDEEILILALDSFASSYRAVSSGVAWVDGGGLIRVCPRGAVRLTLLAYVTAFDASFLEMAHPLGGEISNSFRPSAINGFEESDRLAIEAVVQKALIQAGMVRVELNAVAVVNRAAKAFDWLPGWLGEQCHFFYSRESISHGGGVDLIFNLNELFDAIPRGNILLLGFGLGYEWQAMLLCVE